MIIPRLTLPFLLLATLPAMAQLGPVPLAGQAVMPQGAVAARPLAQKLSDQLSIQDYGAACDGVTDDSNAVRAAGQSGRHVLIPSGVICNAPSVSQATMQGVFIGGGQIRGSDGFPRGQQFSAVRVPPNPQSVGDNCSLGFPCWGKFDYSHSFSAEEFHVSGAATLGQPVGQGSYQSMPGTGAHNLFIDNSSGWNYSHNSNSGRTGGGAYQTILQNAGAGDFGVFGAHIQCGGTVPPGDGNTTPGPDGSIINGYTDWLAVPECGYIGADEAALTDGQYMQLGEFAVDDNGHDVTAIGFVRGYNRLAPTAKINNRWIDELITCNLGVTATRPCDAVQQVGGSWAIGHDFIGASIPAPLAMSSGQKITLNGSMPASAYAEGAPPSAAILGGDWITDDGTGVVLAQNGGSVIRLSNPAGAVDAWQFSGAAAGGYVTMGPSGADSAIAAVLQDKAGGGIALVSNGNVVLNVTNPVANPTAYVHLQGGNAGSPPALQIYSLQAADFGIAGAGTGLVRVIGSVPAAGDASTAVATTAFTQAAAKGAVSAMTGNRYKILNVGSGAALPLPVPAGTINEMIVEIQPSQATIATMALTMPPTSAIPDGFIVHFIATGTITSLGTAASTGQTVLGAPGTISPATPFAFLWDSALADWIPFR